MEGGPPRFPPGSTCPVVLGNLLHSATAGFQVPGCHRLWRAVPDPSPIPSCETSLPRETPKRPRNPLMATRADLAPSRFRLRPVRSPLLGPSRLISLPADTEMFHFSACRSTPPMYSAAGSCLSWQEGCPIRTSPDQRLLAAPRGLSQLATSFIASRSQGIHRQRFVA